jgi:hypothetical protein
MFKIMFYLTIYLHYLACFFWIILGTDRGERYYRNAAENVYISTDGVT